MDTNDTANPMDSTKYNQNTANSYNSQNNNYRLRSADYKTLKQSVFPEPFSFTLNLTSRVFVHLTKDTIYLTGNEGQNICWVFSGNAPLQS